MVAADPLDVGERGPSSWRARPFDNERSGIDECAALADDSRRGLGHANFGDRAGEDVDIGGVASAATMRGASRAACGVGHCVIGFECGRVFGLHLEQER